MKAKTRFYNTVMFLSLVVGLLFIDQTFIFVGCLIAIVACLYNLEVVIPTLEREKEAKLAEKYIKK